ncbi:hypothetical protein KVH15_33480 [Streptomyces olivaceus]|uniref:hypothetical protein n=1 Tax=Streptomyces olivaceus TaxID=47716 RepID=UPI001CCB1D02|nr:hypothetical protein [Streptomyces olivaceus]MBZ6085897.1 hypothetical protein [Streptomyces olivaceus]GHI91719.1 hypothetical protein TPA0905_11900 [Streptomyces olivaceus]
MAGQHTQPHDRKTCPLCGILRHPAQAKQGRALARHLKANPFPQQKSGGQR